MFKKRGYTYYGETISLCEECVSLVPTKIIFEDDKVFYLKRCPSHGSKKTLISTDVRYFVRTKNSFLESVIPDTFQTEILHGCPFDCGLCSEHEQHSCLAIIEIIDDCNMSCPTCIASSFPGAGNQKTLDEVEFMLDTVLASERDPVVMISGGEPTIHPNIIEILQLALSKNVGHLFLITNGKKIAEDQEFVRSLKKLGTGLEIYLQFDSLEKESLVNIRGDDLSQIRRNAVRNLDAKGIPTTLVCVAKNGVNDSEYRKIIEFALQFESIRGVTFQPVKVTGRNDSFDENTNYTTLSDVREKIIASFDGTLFADLNFVPNPSNPENISISYLLRLSDGSHLNVTERLFGDFEHADSLKEMMFFLPRLDAGQFNYDKLFRVAIVSFLDKYNFCVTSLKRSSIHFVTKQGKIIPSDAYYLFYQNTSDSEVLIQIERIREASSGVKKPHEK